MLSRSIFEEYPDFPGSSRTLPPKSLMQGLSEMAERARQRRLPSISTVGAQRQPFTVMEQLIAQGWQPTEYDFWCGQVQNRFFRSGAPPTRFDDKLARETYLAVKDGRLRTTSMTDVPNTPPVNHTPIPTPAAYRKGKLAFQEFMDFRQRMASPIGELPMVNARDAQGNIIQVPQMQLPPITPALLDQYGNMILAEEGDVDKYVAFNAYVEGIVKRGGAPPKTIKPDVTVGKILPGEVGEFFTRYQSEVGSFREAMATKAAQPSFPAMPLGMLPAALMEMLSRAEVGAIIQFGLGAEKYSIIGPIIELITGKDLREHTGHASGVNQQVAYGLGAVSSMVILHQMGGSGFRAGFVRNTPEVFAKTGKEFAREGLRVGGMGDRATIALAKWGAGVQKGTPLEGAILKALRYNVPREAAITFTDWMALSGAQAESFSDILEDTLIGGGVAVFSPFVLAGVGAGAKVGTDEVWKWLGKRELSGMARAGKIPAGNMRELIASLGDDEVKQLVGFAKSKQPEEILRSLGFDKWAGEPLARATELGAKIRFGKTIMEGGKLKIVHPMAAGREAESALHGEFRAVYPVIAARSFGRGVANALNKIVDGFSEVGVDSYTQNMLRLTWGASHSFKQAGLEMASKNLLQSAAGMGKAELEEAFAFITLRGAVPMSAGIIEKGAKLYISPERVLAADKWNVLGFADPKKLLGAPNAEDAIVEALRVTNLGKVYNGLTAAQKNVIEYHDTYAWGLKRIMVDAYGAEIIDRAGYTPSVRDFYDDAAAAIRYSSETKLGAITKGGKPSAATFSREMYEDLGKQVDNMYSKTGLWNQVVSNPLTALAVRTEMLANRIWEDAAIRHAAKHLDILAKPSKMEHLFGDRAVYVRSAIKEGRLHDVVDRFGNKFHVLKDNPDMITPTFAKGLSGTPAGRLLQEQQDMSNLVAYISHTEGADLVHAGKAGILDGLGKRFGVNTVGFNTTKYNPITGGIDGEIQLAKQRLFTNANVGEKNSTYLVPQPLMDLWTRHKFHVSSDFFRGINKTVQGWKRFTLLLAEPGFSTRNFYSDLMAAANLQPEVFTKLQDATWALIQNRDVSGKIYTAGGTVAAAMKQHPGAAQRIKDVSNALRLTDLEFANFGRVTGREVKRRIEDISTALRSQLGSKLTKPQIEALVGLRISEQHGVLATMFVNETAQARGLPITVNRMIDDFRGDWMDKMRPYVGAPMRWWEGVAGIRENVPRLAAELSQIEKIMHGEQVVTKNFIGAGLDKYPLWSASKAVRIVQVDYQNQDPIYRAVLGQGLAPFYVWYAQTARNVAKTLTSPLTATQAAAKYYLPLNAIATWNAQRNVEPPEYVKQGIWVDTGQNDEKTGLPIIVVLDTPISKGAQWFGGDEFFENMPAIMEGQMPLKAVAARMLKRWSMSEGFGNLPPTEVAMSLAMPLWNVLNQGYALMSGQVAPGDLRDGFSGAKVFSEPHVTVEGEPDVQGFMREWSAYALAEVLSPANTLVGQVRRGEIEPPETMMGGVSAAMVGAVTRMGDIQRALGLREVNPQAVRRTNWYNARDKFGGISYARKKAVKDAYVKMMVEGSEDATNKYISEWTELRDLAAVDKGAKGASSWLNDVLDSPWIALDISRKRKAKMLKAGFKKDSPEIKAINAEIEWALNEGAIRSFGSLVDPFEIMAMREVIGETKLPPNWPEREKRD